jgi:hypothetical protein
LRFVNDRLTTAASTDLAVGGRSWGRTKASLQAAGRGPRRLVVGLTGHPSKDVTRTRAPISAQTPSPAGPSTGSLDSSAGHRQMCGRWRLHSELHGGTAISAHAADDAARLLMCLLRMAVARNGCFGSLNEPAHAGARFAQGCGEGGAPAEMR